MELEEYINTVKVKLNASSAISSIEIIDERTFWDRGYFRARLTLSNSDFLEIAESFTIINERCVTLGYRSSAVEKISPKIKDYQLPLIQQH